MCIASQFAARKTQMVIKSPLPLSFVFFLALLSINLCCMTSHAVIHCHEPERQALLQLKQRLDDPSNRLSSWVGKDCCAWQGIGCSNITGRVTELLLRNEYSSYSDGQKFRLRGDINTPSLLSLQHLTHLDLSGNRFIHAIPAFLGSFERLTFLNLSHAGFIGRVPEQLGNLSALQHLDLSLLYYDSYIYYYVVESIGNLYIENPRWITRLTSLRHLNMGGVSFRSASNSIQVLNALPHIQHIELASCDLIGPLPHLNFTSLLTLNLAGNYIKGTAPKWLYNITTLQSLDFSGNGIYWSSMHDSISKLTSLRTLDLSGNSMSKNFLISLSNLCKLQILFLEYMQNKVELYDLEMVFSGCLTYSLDKLYLQGNKINGSFPYWFRNMKNLKHIDLFDNLLHGSIPSSLGSLRPLQYLDLSFNNLNGTIGESIGQLKNLIYLDLSYNLLSLSLIHLANLSSLKYLGISNNTLLMNNTNDWMPQFQLQSLDMDSCKIVPTSHFPKWLQTQTILSSLSFRNERIHGTIPSWLPSNLKYLDMSNNMIGGKLPLQMANMMPNLEELYLSNNYFFGELSQNFTKLRVLDLSFNSFSGHIPLQMANMMPRLESLYLSNNNFIGVVPQNFTKLKVLDLSNNLFTGHFSLTMGNISSSLHILDLSMNHLIGGIPHSLCQMNFIEILHLSKNNFIGELPNCWNSSSNTIRLDFSNNQLHGEIPNTLCNLWRIQSIHLSYNRLSGRIPLCLQDCRNLVNIDIGHNYFIGNIPSWPTESFPYLKSLSLSFNSLSGIIPELSHLLCLQILDFSNNNLTGSIPTSFGNFNALKRLPKCIYGLPGYRFNVYIDKLWLHRKGIEFENESLIGLFTIIDLSGNHLSGYIPKELGNLYRLEVLNLSRNNLTGEIPRSINGMQNLEGLDLSKNSLSGLIPESLSGLYWLSFLNLSYNNLSGRIPAGGQLQTFDRYSYIENPFLCGFPVAKNCTNVTVKNGTNDTVKSGLKEENKDVNDRKNSLWLLTSIVIGFIIGCWVIWVIYLFSVA